MTHRSILVFGLVTLLPDVVHVQAEFLESTKDTAEAVQVGGDTSESRSGFVTSSNKVLASSSLGL
jgi:hypothetical protein